MPTARDLLRRFRPVGTPGAAAPAGVPADRPAELGRELQPVFDELAGTEEEAERIRHAAVTEAGARRERAAVAATAIIETARRTEAAQRADAAAAILQRAAQDREAVLAAAREEAAAVGRRAATRYPEVVGQIVAAVHDSAGDRVPSNAP